MPFVVKDNLIGSQDIATVDTVQRHPLGTQVNAYDPVYGSAQFVYVKGVANCALGSWLLINQDDWSTSLLAANDIGKVGVAMAANVASNYGWAQITGKAVGKVLAGFLDNANVYSTATAGSVDDAVVAGDRVKNAKGASAIGTPAAGLAEFEIDYPFVDDALAA